jgi:hypothetical protein
LGLFDSYARQVFLFFQDELPNSVFWLIVDKRRFFNFSNELSLIATAAISHI